MEIFLAQILHVIPESSLCLGEFCPFAVCLVKLSTLRALLLFQYLQNYLLIMAQRFTARLKLWNVILVNHVFLRVHGFQCRSQQQCFSITDVPVAELSHLDNKRLLVAALAEQVPC
jgi:hypothetical protein